MSSLQYKNRNINITINIHISDVLFFVAFALFLVVEILLSSFYAKYISTQQLRIIRYTWLAILVIREFFMPREYNIPTLIRLFLHNIKWLIFFAIVIIFTIVLKFVTSNNLVLFVLIFALCARNLKFDRIAKISFVVILFTVAFIILSAHFGIIDDVIRTSSTRTRHLLGFLGALYPSMFLFTLTMLFLYIRGKRISWIELVIILFVNALMFLLTNDRLAFIMSVLIVFVFAFFKIKPEFLKGKRVICSLMVFSFIIGFACILILVLLYSDSSPVMVQINDALSKRLSLLQRSISNEGIHLFGQQLDMIGNGLNAWTGEKTPGEYSYIDSFYLQFLLRNGIIFTIIWFALLTATMYLIYRSGNHLLLVCMVFIAIGMTIDDELGRLWFNPFLLLIGSSILQRFMSQHEEKPKLFPGEDGKLVSVMNQLFSWRPTPQKTDENL